MDRLLKELDPESEIIIRPQARMTDDEFFDFCQANEDLMIERNANGEIEIMSPVGAIGSLRNINLSYQLISWTRADGRGLAFDSSVGFYLPNGAERAPDACWVEKSRFERFSRREQERFLHLCPDFVVELRSPSDRLPKLKTKMQEYIDNGAQLGWLLDPSTETVTLYRPAAEPEKITGAQRIEGEGPVQGFVLDLDPIWRPW